MIYFRKAGLGAAAYRRPPAACAARCGKAGLPGLKVWGGGVKLFSLRAWSRQPGQFGRTSNNAYDRVIEWIWNKIV